LNRPAPRAKMHRIMLLSLTLLIGATAAPLGGAPQDAAPRSARVAADGATVRAFFDAKSPAVAELPAGTPLRVVEVREPWARVQAPGGFDVWVHGDYVTWSGSDGKIARANVNARPLPTTEPPSLPVGRFEAGDAVVRVGHEGAWFRVRAPEHVGAWVPLERLTLLDFEPEGWNEEWKRAASARAPVREEPPAPAPKPAPAPAAVAGIPAPAGAAPAAAPATPAAAAAAAAERPHAFPAAQVAKEPSRWLALAHTDLGALRADLTAGFERWDGPRVEELETAFTTVLWHGSLTADLESARQGLASLDALRRSYGAWLAGQERNARESAGAAAAQPWAARLEALARAWGGDGAGGALLTGWVERRPGTDPSLPFAISRNGHAAVVNDFEGRNRLAEFAGREVVVRGTWRAAPELPGGRVLAIAEVRVLTTGR
jgi:hypothetical protein